MCIPYGTGACTYTEDLPNVAVPLSTTSILSLCFASHSFVSLSQVIFRTLAILDVCRFEAPLSFATYPRFALISIFLLLRYLQVPVEALSLMCYVSLLNETVYAVMAISCHPTT